MCWEHMIMVGRAITAQVNQAERRVTVLTETNLSAKLRSFLLHRDKCAEACSFETKPFAF